MHHESDTFITTYTAIDPLRTANAPVALDGFFGWPLSAVASSPARPAGAPRPAA